MSSYITVCLTAGYEENTEPGSGGALNTHQLLILMQPKQELIFLKIYFKAHAATGKYKLQAYTPEA